MTDTKEQWYKNIPLNGMLCKEKISGHIVRIMKKSEYYHGLVLDDCFRENLFDIDELTPLTAAEIWDLMPWQDMETAPCDGSHIIVRDKYGITCHAKFSLIKK